MTYWHFCSGNRRLYNGDGRKIRVGEELWIEGEPNLRRGMGLHASNKLIDALSFARSPILCKVELLGKIVGGDDRSVAQGRRVVAMTDATDVLGAFKRRCALDIAHLWDAPKDVLRFLRTGDESSRDISAKASFPWTQDGEPRYSDGLAYEAAWASFFASQSEADRVYASTVAASVSGVIARYSFRKHGPSAMLRVWKTARAIQNRRLVQMVRQCDWEVV